MRLAHLSIAAFLILSACVRSPSPAALNDYPPPLQQRYGGLLEIGQPIDQIAQIPMHTPDSLEIERQGSIVQLSWKHIYVYMEYAQTFSHYQIYRSMNGGPRLPVGTTTDNVFLDIVNPTAEVTYYVTSVAISGQESGMQVPEE